MGRVGVKRMGKVKEQLCHLPPLQPSLSMSISLLSPSSSCVFFPFDSWVGSSSTVPSSFMEKTPSQQHSTRAALSLPVVLVVVAVVAVDIAVAVAVPIAVYAAVVVSS